MSRQILERPEPIAVVGIGCRFPGGAEGPRQLWRLLLDRTDTVREIPADRWDVGAFYHPDPSRRGKMYSRAGSFLDDVDLFDADFFRISPREAACMDPQQRLLLELTWEALEDGGQVPGQLAGSDLAVFVGVCTTDYGVVGKDDLTSIDAYTNAGASLSIVANRISYIFDFHGPSVAVDTACSSSLVAVHLACQSLARGESALAVAGGVNLIFDPTMTVGFSKANMLSARGRCSAFDERADGFVRAEGGGIVVLKPLSAALAAADPVYAVIRSTAVNQDGRTNGISVPNPAAQADLLRLAYQRAGVPPEAVQYVEAHGTGTPVGDPVECAALGAVLGRGRKPGSELRIGSIKSNIGHTEAASGIAGLIKVSLALKHRYLPASIHFHRPNPSIPFEELGLRVQHEAGPWPDTGGPMVAGVNSFGFGGTSAHVVLEGPPPAAPPRPPRDQDAGQGTSRLRLLPISARSSNALRAYAAAYLDLLAGDLPAGDHPAGDLPAGDPADAGPVADVCHTAGALREHHPYRMAVLGNDRAELRAGVEAYLGGQGARGLTVGAQPTRDRPAVVFVFAGNGSQRWAMGRQLLAAEPVFGAAVAACDSLLSERTGWSVLAELRCDEEHSRLARTDVAQPALFAVQVGLAALWRSWGVEPAAVVGHSVGEVAAAYVSGALDLGQAIDVIHHRSRLQERTAGTGGMAAIGLPPDAVRAELTPYGDLLHLAAVNSPKSVTVSGDLDALRALLDRLAGTDTFTRLLPLRYPFHSHYMDPIREDLVASLAGLAPGETTVPFFSTVTGDAIAGARLSADYWWANVRRPVNFAAAVAHAADQRQTAFLEIGPHPVLRGYLTECLVDSGARQWTVLASLRRDEPELSSLLEALSTMYTIGCEPAWEQVNPGGTRCRLPTYPWQRKRHWREPTTSGRRLSGARVHPLLGSRVEVAHTTYEGQVDLALLPYLADHQVQGDMVFPGAGFIEMALASTDLTGTGGVLVDDFEISRPLLVSAAGAAIVQVSRTEDGVVRIDSRDDGPEWTLHAAGQTRRCGRPRERQIDLAAIRARCPQPIAPAQLYEVAGRQGLHFGPAFQTAHSVWAGDGEALGEVRLTSAAGPAEPYLIHPALLDGCFQTALYGPLLFGARPDQVGELPGYLPVGVSRMRLDRRGGDRLWCHARIVARGPSHLLLDLDLADASGRTVGEVSGLRLQALGRQAGRRGVVAGDDLYQQRWVVMPRPGGHRRRSAAQLPGPGELADLDRVMPDYEQRSRELGRARHYREVAPALAGLATAYIVTALRSLGWDPHPGENVTAARLGQQLRVQDEHARLLAHILRMLADDGVLAAARSGWRVQRPLPSVDQGTVVDAATTWADLALRYPSYQSELLLLARCGTRLADVLTGRTDPLEILFDAASTTLDHFYDSGATMRINNELMRAVVGAIVERLPADASLRVLEIGAGTGGTTSHLLGCLPGDRTRYVYTDVSEAFLHRAAERFGDFRFVRYQLLDIEKDPGGQGFEEHSFDLVVAANVLHATRDLRWTLGNVQRLLASDGVLALLEITNPPREGFLSFGLLRGLWLFLDEDVRPAHTFLPSDRWLDMFAQTGFAEARVLSERQAEPEMSILVARGPTLPEPVPDRAGRCRQWLVFVDSGGEAEELRARLAGPGDRVVTVTRDDRYERTAPDRVVVRPGGARDLDRMWTALGQDGFAFTDVVHTWSLDADGDPTAGGLAAAQRDGCLSVVQITQLLVSTAETQGAAAGRPPRLWLVTRRALALRPGVDAVNVMQSPLVGLRRTIRGEHPQLRCALVDIATPGGGDPWGELADELRADDREDEVLLRGQERYVGRLERAPVGTPGGAPGGASGEAVYGAVRVGSPGILDSLRLLWMHRPEPGPGEVGVEVVAAGLNFKDVMNALGLLPAHVVESGYAGRRALGLECAGRITAVGAGVSDWKVGDEVIASGREALATHLVTEADYVVRKPTRISFEEAATLLMTFATCHYGLRHLAGLQPGERVLVHHGTGGVGLAALQVARAAGAEVFATAGSPEKREYLRLLGVRHVMDSRSLDFADEVMAATDGTGVQVVLNSLTGDGLTESLRVLGRFGRFVEIGKHDLLKNSRLGMRILERCLTLHVVDLEQVQLANRPLMRSLLREVVALVEEGTYRPLPYRVFPVGGVIEAFRHMQKSRHLGKVVISMSDATTADFRLDEPVVPALSPDGVYLVSGGLGGFGLATARWLVDRGARHLVLFGRRGADTPEAADAVAALRAAGAEVVAAAVDVTDAGQVQATVDAIRVSGRLVRGVVHAAMVLDDCLVQNLDEATLQRAVAPKVSGAWNLHASTLTQPLDFFVMYSSAASLVGSAGQANYAAGNAFLDSFAAYRRAQGRPALSVNWGSIADVGYVAARAERDERMVRHGWRAIAPDRALDTLGALLGEQRVQTMVAQVDWESMSPVTPPLWADLLPEQDGQDPDRDRVGRGVGQILAASAAERTRLVAAWLTAELGRVLGSAPVSLNPERSLVEAGLDSLMAMELRIRIESELGIDVPVLRLTRAKTLADLSSYLGQQLDAASGTS